MSDPTYLVSVRRNVGNGTPILGFMCHVSRLSLRRAEVAPGPLPVVFAKGHVIRDVLYGMAAEIQSEHGSTGDSIAQTLEAFGLPADVAAWVEGDAR